MIVTLTNWKRQVGIDQILKFGGYIEKDGLLLQDFMKLIKKWKLCTETD